MLRILLQPFPTFSGKTFGLRMSLIAGLCVFGVLTLFKPFNLHEVSRLVLFQLALIYSLTATVVSMFVVVLLPAMLPRVFDDRHWTVLHEIGSHLFLIMAITLANSVLNIFLYKSNFSFQGFTGMLGKVISIAILPITLGVLLKQKQLVKKFERDAGETEKLIEPLGTDSETTARTTENNILTLTGHNKSERLEVQSDDLLLITASDNYIEIYFLENGKLQKRLFRNTLKSVQESLTNYSEFFRAHKTHLVNLKKVVKVTGNAQGLKLHLAELTEPVPVSRNLTAAIKEKLGSIR
ncbi:MAG: LytTR family transcriptional regulator [Bacteroidetes bacterium]|nr:LytTR family transcriptional regulator [Bacteroidota bacterium]